MGGDHPCPVCKATFTRPQHVARHMRSHTGDRPYKCQQCGDQFARSDLLSRHVNKCHSHNPQPPGQGKSTAANQDMDDKRRACDQCNHSKVRCDFGIPCGKCIQRKTICTYAKPPKKPVAQKDFSDMPSTSASTSVYDFPPGAHMTMSVPGVPLHYLHPSGAVSNDFGLRAPNIPVFGGIGSDYMQMQAPRNMYDSPSPNAPSLTMSVSTLESAGSSPESQNLSNSPNGVGGKGSRRRSLTVPTQPFPYPQQMYSGGQFPVDNGINTTGRLENGPMSAYPYVGGGLTSGNVSALSQPMSISNNWPMLQNDVNNYLPSGDSSFHTRNPSNASSIDPSSLSNWNGSAESSSSNLNSGMTFPLAPAPTINTNLNNSTFPVMDMSNFVNDEFGRPLTAASDGSFAHALDGLTLQDPSYTDPNALYQQYLTNSMPAPQPTMPNPTENLPTGQTPDLWAAFMSEPFGDNTPTAEKQQQVNGMNMPTPLKGFRPQLLTRLSKSNSMPDLTPLAKAGTPGLLQQQQDDKPPLPRHSRTPGEVGKPLIAPLAANAESLKAYQEACLARQAPALRLLPKVKTSRSPTSTASESLSPHLASTLGIQAASPARERSTSGTSQSSVQTAMGRPYSASQPPPQQSKAAYPYTQPRSGSNLRPPGMAAFPTLSPHTRFLSQSLLAQNMQQQQARPSNKRLPSTTLAPDNAKRALFHNLGHENNEEHEYALFEDDRTEFFSVGQGDRRRRQSVPSVSPPTVRSTSASSVSEEPDRSHASTLRPRIITDAMRFPAAAPQLVNQVQ
ncbi:hypothetical protein DACRYDRAFT_114100 [Dacryopinax primogenitus]|uniref:Zn(2)-C6 fungal-type domain-containing protein n=1 Tax=Dacryopinax primogenitus (strain DJM 731) TaxID=1858805 RepID=M5GG30_DACPD|nr:uncharacterized protein DACRYDRAFT_114100 [Dacryopinax primogenitus]EJU04773.1 hypothetical protein DACRYDRAFT_114100 [Dacryopinax primogenitus]